LRGNAGNDTYVVDATGDVVIELAGEGVDTVLTSVAALTLADQVENLTYTGTAAFTGTGNTLDNTITGGNGNDNLNGAAGNDTLSGGLGNDTYTVDSTGDVVNEAAAAGTDTVRTVLSSYTLGANLENLSYNGTAAFSGTGNELNNALVGGVGDDTLDGGAGNDTMTGGAGNDTYFVDSATDVVTESLATNGTDTVRTSLGAYTLSTNVDNLVYTGTAAFSGTGNTLDNVITAGDGNDSLSGGTGSDTMIGGLGNDTYTVDAAGDSIVEVADAGIDTVRTTLTAYTLADTLENLAYTSTLAFTGTGNGAANTLTGGTGNDTLMGGDGNDTLDGGAGSDSMIGGAGNDTYVVSVATDIIVEGIDTGVDLVRTALGSYTLAANVENLTYTGTGAFSGSGNELNNIITGGNGGDTLNGLAGNDTLIGSLGNDVLNGGAGVDTLTGNDGADRFVFSTLTDSGLSAALRDLITDFTSGSDRIDLSALDANASVAGNQAFTWRGTGAITGAAQVNMAYDAASSTTVISANVDSDLNADITLALAGNYTAALAAIDFVL